MTDKEKFRALMQEFRVPLVPTGREAAETLTFTPVGGERVTGCREFFADFVFDAVTGNFIRIHIWK